MALLQTDGGHGPRLTILKAAAASPQVQANARIGRAATLKATTGGPVTDKLHQR